MTVAPVRLQCVGEAPWSRSATRASLSQRRAPPHWEVMNCRGSLVTAWPPLDDGAWNGGCRRGDRTEGPKGGSAAAGAPGCASRSRGGYATRTAGQLDRLRPPSRIRLERGPRSPHHAGQWPTTYVPRTDRGAGCSSVEFDARSGNCPGDSLPANGKGRPRGVSSSTTTTAILSARACSIPPMCGRLLQRCTMSTACGFPHPIEDQREHTLSETNFNHKKTSMPAIELRTLLSNTLARIQ